MDKTWNKQRLVHGAAMLAASAFRRIPLMDRNSTIRCRHVCNNQFFGPATDCFPMCCLSAAFSDALLRKPGFRASSLLIECRSHLPSRATCRE